MIAIFSDIHANITAFKAVLKDASGYAIRRLFCLGDIVGYGPDSVECVDFLQKLDATCVRGNHEELLGEYGGIGTYFEEMAADEVVAQPIELAWKQLTPEKRKWLERLPLKRKFAAMELVHSSLFCPEEFLYIDGSGEAERNFSHQMTSLSFHGHTHTPAVWVEHRGKTAGYVLPEEPFALEPEHRYAINVGSVGQPRDDDPRASYVLFDPRKRIVIPRRVAYCINTARKRFKRAKLPEFNSRRLETGF